MTQIFYQMAQLCSGHETLLPKFINASSAGQRLVAIAMLHQMPDPAQLEWLARRLDPEPETPFVGFQAAVALQGAVRRLGDEYMEPLAQSLRTARALAERNRNDPLRIQALAQAQSVLQRRLAGRGGKGDPDYAASSATER